MQQGFYFDQSRCIGCLACVAACRSWNQLPQEAPDLIQINADEKGEYPNLSLSHQFLTCFHCADPACVDACPDGLLTKRAEDGVVVITKAEQCTNCQQCVEACPYGAPKMATGGTASILKCEMCLGRIAEGKKPACVATCPTEALDAGPMDELKAKYGGTRELPGFADYRKTNPSVIFRAKK